MICMSALSNSRGEKTAICSRAGHRCRGRYDKKVLRARELSVAGWRNYRIIVSDLERGRPIWVGGEGRKEADIDLVFQALGDKKSARIELMAMDMWKSFRTLVRREDRGHCILIMSPALAVGDEVGFASFHLFDAYLFISLFSAFSTTFQPRSSNAFLATSSKRPVIRSSLLLTD
jgi:hypothetical protein